MPSCAAPVCSWRFAKPGGPSRERHPSTMPSLHTAARPCVQANPAQDRNGLSHRVQPLPAQLASDGCNVCVSFVSMAARQPRTGFTAATVDEDAVFDTIERLRALVEVSVLKSKAAR